MFRATREDGHSTQTAALKILTGLPTAKRSSACIAERQILASLSHPNIARLIDGGTTPRGRPYSSADLVEGEDIEMCKHKRPDLATRVALLRQICLACGLCTPAPHAALRFEAFQHHGGPRQAGPSCSISALRN